MPTFPSSPLRFRTAGFPQYGSKAGLSDGAFPRGVLQPRRIGLRPSSCPPQQISALRTVSETPARSSTAIRAASAALPQGPSLRSGLFCPGPSTLNRPHPPHSPAHRDFAAVRLIRRAFAVSADLGHQRVVPCFRCPFPLGMSSSKAPGSPLAARTQFLRQRRWPSSRRHGLGTPIPPAIRFRRETHFEASWFADSLRPVELFAPLADLTGSSQPTGTFTSGLSAGRSPFPPPDMATVATGQVPLAGLSPARTSASIAARRLGV